MRSSDIKPKKSLGQNFLINQGVLEKIVRAAEVGPEDIVVEVGPGTGNLTKKLSEKAKRVIAIEKDRRLIEDLKEKFKNSNIEIIEGDILKFDPSRYSLVASGYKIVANIPYYITSNFIRIIFENWPRPKLIVLTIQKEVAQRIVARPPNMNLLALSVQLYSDPKIVSYVSKGSFRPIPKVDSAVIKLTTHNQQLTTSEKDNFFKLTKAGFSGKRKQLINNLIKNFDMIREDLSKIFERIGIRQDARAESLSLEQWKKLINYVKK